MVCEKKIGKMIGAAVLACAILFVSLPQGKMSSVSAATLSQLQDHQKELKGQKAANDKKLKELKKDAAKQQEYKKTLNKQIKTIQKQVDSYNLEINQLNQKIQEKESKIAKKQVNIDANYDKLKERLCALYKAGEASTLAIILDAENISDMLRKAEIMKAVTEHDAQLINVLKTEVEEIADEKREIEDAKAKFTESRTALQDSQNELKALMEEAESLLTDLEKKQRKKEMENEALREDMKKADAALDQWYADYYASQQNSSSNKPSSPKPSPSNKPTHSTGQFMWPVPGYYGAITQGFHYGHHGLDISGGGIYGQPIVAADAGYVMFAGFGSAANCHNRYGYCVDIDHGNGYSTRYAHCSALAVSSGTYVEKGQVIGYVGNTGQSYGAHLHFEIRHYGTPVNPSNYV